MPTGIEKKAILESSFEINHRYSWADPNHVWLTGALVFVFIFFYFWYWEFIFFDCFWIPGFSSLWLVLPTL